MDRVDQPEVGKFDSFRNIDWTYEFSAPKYYDFTYEETDADALAAEGWFELAIPYENSRTCSFFPNQFPNKVNLESVTYYMFELNFGKEV